jgi:hypothetical protein
MNRTTTRWLLILTAALAAFIVLFERHTTDSATRAARATRLFPQLDTKEVTGLAVTLRTNFTIRLEREGERWQYRAPVRYPAQPAGPERLLEGVARLRWASHVRAEEVLAQSNSLAAFGFNPPAAILVAQQADRRIELRLGGATVLGSQLYAQVVGREGLYTIDTSLLRQLPASPDDWRDTALADLASLRFDRLEVRPLTNGFEVVRNPTNRQWQMTKPLLTRADNNKLGLLLQELELARVIRFVSDDPRADIEPLGLLPPERELVFSQGTNDLLVLQLGRSPTNAPDQMAVRRLAHSNVVLAARAPLVPWLAGFREFCDRRLMVFDPDAVTRIEVRAKETFALERATNGSWRIAAPVPAAADRLLVLEFLQELAQLEFLEFEREVVADFATYGLDPPRRQYTLLAAAPLEGGGVTNLALACLDLGNATGFKCFARRSPETSVVTFADNNRLPAAAFALRDRQIWEFTTNQIVSLTIRQAGATRRLLRTGPAQWTLAAGSAGPINPMSLEEAAYRLGRLRAERWIAHGADELPRYGFGAIDHEIVAEVAVDGRTLSRTVRFGRQSSAGRSAFAAVTLPGIAGPVVFECPAFLYDFVQSDLSVPPGAP